MRSVKDAFPLDGNMTLISRAPATLYTSKQQAQHCVDKTCSTCKHQDPILRLLYLPVLKSTSFLTSGRR